MKKQILLLAFAGILSLTTAFAQRPKADVLETKTGKVTIQPITHGSLVLTFQNKTIYVDPYGGAELYKGLKAPDLILFTDIHPDHLDKQTLSGLDLKKAKIVAPQAVADSLPAEWGQKTTVVKNGGTTTQLGIKIKALPMYNLPEEPTAMHPKGRGNGYLLTLGDKTIYIAGDTEDIPEMRSLKNIDVAFVPMNLPYTMPVEQAAEGVLAFKPKVVYPYHYRGQDGLSDVEEFKKLVNQGNKKIEVRLRNWYPENKK